MKSVCLQTNRHNTIVKTAHFLGKIQILRANNSRIIGLRMQSFQRIIFIQIRTYRDIFDIFKSVQGSLKIEGITSA